MDIFEIIKTIKIRISANERDIRELKSYKDYFHANKNDEKNLRNEIVMRVRENWNTKLAPTKLQALSRTYNKRLKHMNLIEFLRSIDELYILETYSASRLIFPKTDFHNLPDDAREQFRALGMNDKQMAVHRAQQAKIINAMNEGVDTGNNRLSSMLAGEKDKEL